MSKPETVTRSGIGEDIGIVFLSSVIDSLNAVLKESGLVDRSAREKILGDFVFNFAMKLDQPDEIKVKGEGFKAVLCFRSTQDESKLVYSTAFDYHDYAHANVLAILDEEQGGAS